MQTEVITKANSAVEDLVSESFIREGRLIVSSITSMLEEREQDTDTLAKLIEKSPDVDETKRIIKDFYLTHQNEIWFNTNTDLEPSEEKEIIPLYSTIAFIDLNGQEILKISEGEFTDDLKDVSDPRNTEYRNETYFQDTMKYGFSVSHLNTWYMPVAEARQGAPEGTKTYNVVPGRDTKKRGDIKFSKKTSKGIIVLSLDYRHLQELTKHIDPSSNTEKVSTSYEGNYILFYDDEGNTIVHPKPNNIRGYLEDGTLEHTNTKATPGGIFNLRDYDKTDSYQNIFRRTIIDKETYLSSSTDLSGRNKMTVALPIPYSKGPYQDTGTFGGIMMSINTDIFYGSVNEIKNELSDNVEFTRKDIMRVIQSLNQKSKYLIGITLFVAMLFGFFFTRKLTKPITDLTEAGKKLADGDISVEIPVINTKDEVEDLSHTIGILAGSLKYHMNKLRQKKK